MGQCGSAMATMPPQQGTYPPQQGNYPPPQQHAGMQSGLAAAPYPQQQGVGGDYDRPNTKESEFIPGAEKGMEGLRLLEAQHIFLRSFLFLAALLGLAVSLWCISVH